MDLDQAQSLLTNRTKKIQNKKFNVSFLLFTHFRCLFLWLLFFFFSCFLNFDGWDCTLLHCDSKSSSSFLKSSTFFSQLKESHSCWSSWMCIYFFHGWLCFTTTKYFFFSCLWIIRCIRFWTFLYFISIAEVIFLEKSLYCVCVCVFFSIGCVQTDSGWETKFGFRRKAI